MTLIGLIALFKYLVALMALIVALGSVQPGDSILIMIHSAYSVIQVIRVIRVIGVIRDSCVPFEADDVSC